MQNRTNTDPFLGDRLTRYDRWLAKGQISYSARVIPVAASLNPRQWVLPTGQALDILRAATSVALQPCECRTHYRRCDNPVDVCFLLGPSAECAAAAGEARPVTLGAAEAVLTRAAAAGLVHLGLYMPDHQLYALCNCCPCCCHDLQIVARYARPDLVHSDYFATTDLALCIDCGDCVDRCPFGARTLRAGRLAYDPAACLGCGLCVLACPTSATALHHRTPDP